MKRKTSGRSARGATATEGKGARAGKGKFPTRVGNSAAGGRSAHGRSDTTVAGGTPKVIDFQTFARTLDFMSVFLDGHVAEKADAADMSLFIYNQGTAEDRAELLLAVAPIAKRVYGRTYAEKD